MKYKEYETKAKQYELSSFTDLNSINFCRKYSNKKDIEISGLISAWLTFGEYGVYTQKIDNILTNIMGNKPYDYIMSDKWNIYIDNYSCLYRVITWHNFAMLCRKLKFVYLNNKDLEEEVLKNFTNRNKIIKYYHQSLCDVLSGETMITTVSSMSANKRMNMFLMWMVRKSKPFGLNIWKKFDQKLLLIPCDFDIINVAKENEIISKIDETLKVVIKITEYAKKYFIDDPCIMYFALYKLAHETITNT